MTQSLLLLEVTCPNCKSLLTRGQHVPLGIHCVETGEDGEVRLSALFGDYAVETDLVIAEGATAEFWCPFCEQSLMVDTPCKLCGAPLASLNLQAGGSIEFCSRRGCRGHALGGFGDLDEMIELLNRMFKIPHD
jgi:hypothetical protein